ncbi:MAG: hypothetical protein WEB03_03040 [Nitriliruptor sp.]|uniref:CsbD family protein n=1 Tax=Nitriliruptor sp. TaxID=2448056 RepID=UPI0034A02622
MSDDQGEKLKGVAKETVGKMTDKDDLQAEGEQQQQKAQKNEEAERLEQEAEHKKHQAAGHEGEQRKRQD